MILDSQGCPLRRRLGFLRGYEPEPDERPQVALVAYREVPVEDIDSLETSERPE